MIVFQQLLPLLGMELMLVGIFVAAYFMLGRTYISPVAIYIASFIFSVAWAIGYANAWELNLNLPTFAVIVGGAVCFCVIGVAVHEFYPKCSDKEFGHFEYGYELGLVRQILFMLFAVATLLLTIDAIRRITGVASLSAAINTFRNANGDTESSVRLSGLPYYMGTVLRAAGYWYAYFVGSPIGYKQRLSPLTLVNYALCLAYSLLSGGRNDLVCMLLAAAVLAIYARSRFSKRRTQRLEAKQMGKILLLMTGGLVAFALLSTVIGRTMNGSNYLYYIAIYCGASIKNLNTFLGGAILHSDIWGKLTFIGLINYLGARFGVPGWRYSVIEDYNAIGDLALGNVYSTYYAFIKDFSYIGVVALAALMAIITQLNFEHMKNSYTKTNLPAIFYGFISGTLAFSFFSNKFYETVFSPSSIKYVLCWIALNILFGKMKLKIKGK